MDTEAFARAMDAAFRKATADAAAAVNAHKRQCRVILRDTAGAGVAPVSLPPHSPLPTKRAALRQDHLQFIRKHRPANTTAAYATGTRSYNGFLAENALEGLADTPEAVVAYMRDSLDSGKAQSTIAGAVSAISDGYRYEPSNPALDPLVAQMQRVVRRLTKPSKETAELPKELFLRMLDDMDIFINRCLATARLPAALRALRDRLAFLIIYCTFQRPKSVVELQRDDVTQEGPPAFVRLNFIGHQADGTYGPKNAQGGRHLSEIASNADERLDLSKWLEKYTMLEEQLWGPECDIPKWLLYNTTKKDFGKRLAPSTFNTLFKKWLARVDPAAEYTLYCIKVGAVSTSRRAGMTKDQRKAHGGWRSDAGDGYNRQTQEERLTTSQLL